MNAEPARKRALVSVARRRRASAGGSSGERNNPESSKNVVFLGGRKLFLVLGPLARLSPRCGMCVVVLVRARLAVESCTKKAKSSASGPLTGLSGLAAVGSNRKLHNFI